MFDLGWSELFLIMVVAIVVIGPKEIPEVMRGLGRIVRRLQYMRFALTQQFDDIMKEHDLDDLRKGVNFEARHLERKDFDERSADGEEEDVKEIDDRRGE
jgi:Tat protein translocase TatB subunit